ncbi:CKLF-like MARVEL transmembrane domain-containing protein 3 [Carcharodon carcharias]|uniref:CKLF-like MARVEL transmembrane domain-containing protein 3 n=1 Tax=Carcharodon carcharias TaxID=13397 RepID=UPI001B7E61B1|nr:CKLF-like MARVEL transmembrane domain-containing protein 3 [Carcharodon carcharias]
MEVNLAFLKSLRSALKIAEMVGAFVTFVSFAISSSGVFIAVPLMEIFITLAFYLLYLLKLDVKVTLLFWPLMDSVNSVFAALLLLIICIAAVVSRVTAGVITGSVFGFIAVTLYIADAYIMCRLITFNQCKIPSK